MKKFLIALLVMVSAMSVSITDADAKRLGGGGSIGRQSSNVTRQAMPPSNPGSFSQSRPTAPTSALPATTPPKPGIPWKGIAGGLIGGALLGAALSHFGLGGAAASMLGSLLTFALLAVAIMFVIRLFRRNSDQGADMAAYTPAYGGVTPPVPTQQPMAYNGSGAGNAAPWNVPADFDVPGFLRNAKTYFIRLQAAWDKADINDLREFTTAEMYAELKLQIQERGATPNVTDVITLNAELLGIETTASDHMASIKFTGVLKEAMNAPEEPFAEVWNLTKPANGSGGWVLAGIQQLS